MTNSPPSPVLQIRKNRLDAVGQTFACTAMWARAVLFGSDGDRFNLGAPGAVYLFSRAGHCAGPRRIRDRGGLAAVMLRAQRSSGHPASAALLRPGPNRNREG